mmetsp:Transcript_122133/g.353102  ORF Transcript_122133/g.353102 Transcript_122133/m.353102 type:complete len:407 (-) Transcript_122133:335-1555(-)
MISAAGHNDTHAGLQLDLDVRKLVDPRVVLNPLALRLIRVEARKIEKPIARDWASAAADQVSVKRIEDGDIHLPVKRYEQVVGLVVVPEDADRPGPQQGLRPSQPLRRAQGLLHVDRQLREAPRVHRGHVQLAAQLVGDTFRGVDAVLGDLQPGADEGVQPTQPPSRGGGRRRRLPVRVPRLGRHVGVVQLPELPHRLHPAGEVLQGLPPAAQCGDGVLPINRDVLCEVPVHSGDVADRDVEQLFGQYLCGVEGRNLPLPNRVRHLGACDDLWAHGACPRARRWRRALPTIVEARPRCRYLITALLELVHTIGRRGPMHKGPGGVLDLRWDPRRRAVAVQQLELPTALRQCRVHLLAHLDECRDAFECADGIGSVDNRRVARDLSDLQVQCGLADRSGMVVAVQDM